MVVVSHTIFGVGGCGMSFAANSTVGAISVANMKVVAPFVAVATLLGVGLVDPGTNSTVFTSDGDWVADEFGGR